MSNHDICASSLTGLAENVDDLLEALSALQRLSELPAHKLTKSTLLKEVLRILYQSCHTTSCTVLTWPSELHQQQPEATTEKIVMAIDSNGIVHQRITTPIENHFINNAIQSRYTQTCSDCTSLGDEYPCKAWEKAIISVPVFDTDQLTGVITISHSQREHLNPWWHNLMETLSRFLGQQLTICRIQS